MAYTTEQQAKINELEASTDGTPIDVGVYFDGEPVAEETWNTRQSLLDGLFTRLWYRITQRYLKPALGIPKTDLTNNVQISLGAADTAYQKPGPGIPASDLNIRWRDPVANLAALPASGNTTGDVRLTVDTGIIYWWDSSAWIVASGSSNMTFTKFSGTGAGGESVLATTTDLVAKSVTVTIDGIVLSEQLGHFSVNLSNGNVTLSTALVVGEQWEIRVATLS